MLPEYPDFPATTTHGEEVKRVETTTLSTDVASCFLRKVASGSNRVLSSSSSVSASSSPSSSPSLATSWNLRPSISGTVLTSISSIGSVKKSTSRPRATSCSRKGDFSRSAFFCPVSRGSEEEMRQTQRQALPPRRREKLGAAAVV